MKKIKSFFETLVGCIVLFSIIGLLTGNLGKWTGNIIYYAKAIWHTVSNIDMEKKYEEGTPEAVIDKYIKALFAGDDSAAKQCIDVSNPVLTMDTEIMIEFFQSASNDIATEILFKDMSKADYTIEKKGTEFLVTFRTYNFENIMKSFISYDGYAETEEEVYKILKEKIYSTPKNLEYTINFEMKDKHGQWVISEYENETDLFNAVTGNLVQYALGDTENGMGALEAANMVVLYKGIWTYETVHHDNIVLELECNDELLEAEESANAFLTFYENETGKCYEAIVPLVYENGKLSGDCEYNEIDGKLEVKVKKDKIGIVVSFTPSDDMEKEIRERFLFKEREFVKAN